MQTIGFIGLGIMGKPIALNLIKAGYNLLVYDVNPVPLKELEKEEQDFFFSNGNGRKLHYYNHYASQFSRK